MSDFKTLKKFTDNIPNEDNCCVSDDMIVISDGAGGCGVFASDWSKYLAENLFVRSTDSPIINVDDLDNWIGEIWENFYNEHELKAQEYDGIFQSKFYGEGSYATLAAVWRTGQDLCHWITYGDSVVFHYQKSTGKLEYSFTKLADFSKAPYLIGFKEELHREGFNSGDWILDEDSVVFAASDALSHYILMMYYINHSNDYQQELDDIMKSHDSDAQMLSLAKSDGSVSFDMLICKLQDIVKDQNRFDNFVKELYQRGVMDIDDFTLAILKYDNTICNTH